MPGISPVRLGVALAAPQARRLGGLGQVSGDPGPLQLLHDVPPPGAPLDRELNARHAAEPAQPPAQALPVRRTDPATSALSCPGIDIVEGQLTPVQIEPSSHRHRTPPGRRSGTVPPAHTILEMFPCRTLRSEPRTVGVSPAQLASGAEISCLSVILGSLRAPHACTTER